MMKTNHELDPKTREVINALKALLDDLYDAREDRNEDGREYSSVARARKALKAIKQ